MDTTTRKRIVLTGATGLIGTALYQRLKDRYAMTILSRNPMRAKERFPDAERHILWSPGVQGEWKSAIDGAYAVVHLAGESLFAARWSETFKRKIRESRIQGTGDIVSAIRAAKCPPEVLLSSSAVGYYGDTKNLIVDEDTPPGNDFLATVCAEWEDAARQAHGELTRVCTIRTGLVLAQNGGSLVKMLPAFRYGLGAWFGKGDQWFPWVHIDDITGILEHALASPDMQGAFNACAPGIVTNKQFSKMLGSAMHRPVVFAVPGWILRLILGEFAEALLTGQRVQPKRTMKSGYRFRYPELPEALTVLLGREI